MKNLKIEKINEEASIQCSSVFSKILHYRPTPWKNSYIFVICQAHFILIFKNCKSANFYYIFLFEFMLSHIFSIVPLEDRLDPELLAFEVSQMLSHSFL